MSDKDDMLQEAAQQFRLYAELHAAKGTKEGRDKAEVNLQFAMNCEAAAKGPAEDLLNDRKFKIADGRLVNRVSGMAIPAHEPVFIFRARDRHLKAVLAFYQTIVLDPHHRRAVGESIVEVEKFAIQHPEQMKEPGITHDFKLKDPQDLRVPTKLDRIEQSPDGFTITGYWSDGVATTLDLRNFRNPSALTTDAVWSMMFERRFYPPERKPED